MRIRLLISNEMQFSVVKYDCSNIKCSIFVVCSIFPTIIANEKTKIYKSCPDVVIS